MGMRMSRMIATRPDVVGKLEPGFGVDRGSDFEPLELEHSRKRIRNRPIVVYDKDGLGCRLSQRALGRGNHRIIMRPNEIPVKRLSRLTYRVPPEVP